MRLAAATATVAVMAGLVTADYLNYTVYTNAACAGRPTSIIAHYGELVKSPQPAGPTCCAPAPRRYTMRLTARVTMLRRSGLPPYTHPSAHSNSSTHTTRPPHWRCLLRHSCLPFPLAFAVGCQVLPTGTTEITCLNSTTYISRTYGTAANCLTPQQTQIATLATECVPQPALLGIDTFVLIRCAAGVPATASSVFTSELGWLDTSGRCPAGSERAISTTINSEWLPAPAVALGSEAAAAAAVSPTSAPSRLRRPGLLQWHGWLTQL